MNSNVFISNKLGIAGAVLPKVSLDISATDAIRIPCGLSSERPTQLQTGQVRFNTETQVFEGYGTNSWGSLGGVKDVDQDTYISAETNPGDDNDQLKFYTLDYERMIIDANGDVSMNSNLNISGDLSLNGTLNGLTVGQGGHTAIITSNIAIGTDVLQNNTTAGSNTAIGNSVLKFNTTGYSNTATGFAALQNNITGNSNSAFGYYALTDLSAGSYNVGIGNGSGNDLTTGSFNTFLGYNAKTTKADCEYSTAIGYYASITKDSQIVLGVGASEVFIPGDLSLNGTLNGVTVGLGGHDTSVAVGFNALLSNTTGYQNTATGSWALENNTTGKFNSVYGSIALRNNTTGERNVAIGTKTSFENKTGNENTAVGMSAMENNITGSWNSAVGHFALFDLSAGNYNVGIGKHSGNDLTIGTSNTFLGHSTSTTKADCQYSTAIGYFASITKDSQIVLGVGASEVFIPGDLSLNGTLNGLTVGQGGNSTSTAIGSNALDANTGADNTATGYRALFSNTTAIRNVAYGTKSLYYNSTGHGNTAIGCETLLYNTTSYNTAIGSSVLYNNTTGTYNTAIGTGAGYSNTTGFNNTFLGANTNTTSAWSYSTAIGYQAVITKHRQIVLGTSNEDVFIPGKLEVDGDINFTGTLYQNDVAFSGGVEDADGDTYISADNGADNDELKFYTHGTERMVINSTGNVGIAGDADATYKLNVTGEVQSTGYNVTSDIRHKENIHELENALEKILSIRGVKFTFINDDKKRIHAGIIAQEVEPIIPELINTTDDEKWSANYDGLTPYLIESVKTLSKENEQLKEKVNTLEEKFTKENNELKEKLNSLIEFISTKTN